MTVLPLDKAVPGRSCGSCSLCCKLPYIEHADLNKPSAVWCRHCKPGSGCKIYDSRPAPCRGFYCGWLARPELGDEWRPTTSKMVVCFERNRIAIHVDPGYPTNWRKEPYREQIKRWSVFSVDNEMQVVVYIKDRCIVVLPNKEVDLGVLAYDDIILIAELNISPPRDWDVFVKAAKDVPAEERDQWIVKGPASNY